MCQPKPGPRCSSHAATAVQKAKEHLAAVQNQPDPDETLVREARDGVREALNDYACTSAGLDALARARDAIAEEEGVGTERHHAAQSAWEDAHNRREEMMADLRASNAYKARLHQPSDDAAAYLDDHLTRLSVAAMQANSANDRNYEEATPDSREWMMQASENERVARARYSAARAAVGSGVAYRNTRWGVLRDADGVDPHTVATVTPPRPGYEAGEVIRGVSTTTDSRGRSAVVFPNGTTSADREVLIFES